jgi:GNAT superfamily N-acetyltransferase
MSDPTCRLVQLDAAEQYLELEAQIEAIFWQTSARTFAQGPERDAYRERWLGRYMQGGSDVVLLALVGEDTVAGYLVGALENPTGQARFADIGYFRTDFADLTRRFPAHLHINLAAALRSRGIGAQLIEAFAGHAKRAGAPGMHAVTGKGMRNVGFYQRCGFAERGSATWNGRQIVFLGRDLGQTV